MTLLIDYVRVNAPFTVVATTELALERDTPVFDSAFPDGAALCWIVHPALHFRNATKLTVANGACMFCWFGVGRCLLRRFRLGRYCTLNCLVRFSVSAFVFVWFLFVSHTSDLTVVGRPADSSGWPMRAQWHSQIIPGPTRR